MSASSLASASFPTMLLFESRSRSAGARNLSVSAMTFSMDGASADWMDMITRATCQ
jgi:hypothetical protein